MLLAFLGESDPNPALSSKRLTKIVIYSIHRLLHTRNNNNDNGNDELAFLYTVTTTTTAATTNIITTTIRRRIRITI